MDLNNRVKKIVSASLFSRTFGAIIDLVITIFIGAGIYLAISSIASNVSWIKAYKDDYTQTIVDSGLMKLEKGELEEYKYDNYEDYQTMFYDFYHNYYSQETNKTYDKYWFNVFIYGQDDVLNKYEAKELNSRPNIVKIYGPAFFTYKLDESSAPLYEEFALPKESNNGVNELSETTKKQLRDYFYVADEDVKEGSVAAKEKYIYYYALSDLTSRTKLQNDYNHYAFFASTFPLVIAIFVTFMIFYFLIPLCFKNGETIGKKVMHTCLVNKLGYQYSRLQLIPRFLFPTFLIIAVIFITGFSIWSLLITSVAFLASYIFAIFSKNNRAFHDIFAGTLVVDARESTWFKNAEEEEKTQREIDEYVESVRSSDINASNDNIIYTNPHFKGKQFQAFFDPYIVFK